MPLLQTSKAWGKIFNTKIMEEPTYTFTWRCHPTMSKRRLCISPMTTLNNTKMCLESMKILLISFCFSLHHPPSPLPSYNVRGWFFFLFIAFSNCLSIAIQQWQIHCVVIERAMVFRICMTEERPTGMRIILNREIVTQLSPLVHQRLSLRSDDL